MKFIIQDLPVPYDFMMELYRSQNYYDWRGDKFRIVKTSGRKIKNPKEYCPVGSVEFVVQWYDLYWGKKPMPINCPDIFATNQIHLPTPLIIEDEIKKSFPNEKYVFIKSEKTIKSELNGKYSVSDPQLSVSFPDPVVVRPWIDDIISEWRLFIKDNEILDIKNYLGDPFVCPKKKDCEDLVRQCSLLSSRPAYTLDVGIRSSGKIIVLEVHDFFSCGTYGFSDYQRYPIMLWRWFKWFTRNE